MQRYEETKTVVDLSERGMVRKTTKRDDKRIVNVFSRNPQLMLHQGQEKLKEKSLDISYKTIRSYLRVHNLKWRSRMKKFLLSENMEKRSTWAHKNIDRD